MTPNVHDRISSMQRTLMDIVLPAIPPEQGMAVEQVQLVIGHLAVLGEQFDLVHLFERAECRQLEELAAALLSVVDGGQNSMAAAQALQGVLSAGVDGEARNVREHIVALSRGIEQLVEASGVDGSARFIAASTDLILRSNEITSQCNRSFFRSMGFERGDVDLPPVRDLIGG
ncbi:hypothetical protein [Aquisediminimonas sediminicola]|uniref:hypothetical protein n=1 Tax=Alteraquisediminimonas sediminicola TaxID=2676787 RepID=UPI001C8EC251|nr:hypothetical protein [Aquisediminimonas sediminicola]